MAAIRKYPATTEHQRVMLSLPGLPNFNSFGAQMPPGSIIAFAGYVGPPVSSPPDSEASTYHSPPSIDGYTNDIEAWGWMVCDGRQLYCHAYPELFLALGFLYVQSGEPTYTMGSKSIPSDAKFRIPDYRGYFLRGVGYTSEQDPDIDKRVLASGASGNDVGSFQPDALQDHEHAYQLDNVTGTPNEEGEPAMIPPGQNNELTGPPTDNGDLTGNGNVRVSTETRSKNAYVQYLIKYANVAT